jgi:acyl carrier protein
MSSLLHKSADYRETIRKRVVTEASFTNDLGADSLDTVELIMDSKKNLTFKSDDQKILLLLVKLFLISK